MSQSIYDKYYVQKNYFWEPYKKLVKFFEDFEPNVKYSILAVVGVETQYF